MTGGVQLEFTAQRGVGVGVSVGVLVTVGEGVRLGSMVGVGGGEGIMLAQPMSKKKMRN